MQVITSKNDHVITISLIRSCLHSSSRLVRCGWCAVLRRVCARRGTIDRRMIRRLDRSRRGLDCTRSAPNCPCPKYLKLFDTEIPPCVKRMSSLRMLLLVALICLHWSSIHCGKRNLPLDLIVIIGPQWTDDLIGPIRKALRALPEEYTLAEMFTQVTLVTPSPYGYWYEPIPEPGFTTNVSVFNRSVKSVERVPKNTSVNSLDEQLQWLVNARFGATADSSKTRFIIVLLPDKPIHLSDPNVASRMPIIPEADIFVFSNGGNRTELLEFVNGDESKLKIVDGPEEFERLLPVVFGEMTERIIYTHACHYEEHCFHTGGVCVIGWWTPRLPTAYFDCEMNNYPPPGRKLTALCEKYECFEMCDNLWPPNSTCTEETCEQPRKRGGKPIWKQLESCPPTVDPNLQCGRCVGFGKWVLPVAIVSMIIGVGIGVAAAGHVVVKRRRIRRLMESKKEAGKGSLMGEAGKGGPMEEAGKGNLMKQAGTGSVAVSLRAEASNMEKSAKKGSVRGSKG